MKLTRPDSRPAGMFSPPPSPLDLSSLTHQFRPPNTSRDAFLPMPTSPSATRAVHGSDSILPSRPRRSKPNTIAGTPAASATRSHNVTATNNKKNVQEQRSKGALRERLQTSADEFHPHVGGESSSGNNADYLDCTIPPLVLLLLLARDLIRLIATNCK